MLPKQVLQLVADQPADRLWSRLSPSERNLVPVKLAAVQICQQKGDAPRNDLNGEQAAAFRLEADHIRRSSAAGLALAQRLYQVRGQQILHDVGHVLSAESGRPDQVRSR